MALTLINQFSAWLKYIAMNFIFQAVACFLLNLVHFNKEAFFVRNKSFYWGKLRKIKNRREHTYMIAPPLLPPPLPSPSSSSPSSISWRCLYVERCLCVMLFSVKRGDALHTTNLTHWMTMAYYRTKESPWFGGIRDSSVRGTKKNELKCWWQMIAKKELCFSDWHDDFSLEDGELIKLHKSKM